MSKPKMPTDANDNPIPALALRNGGSHTIAVTATSAKNTNPFPSTTKVVSVYATVDVFIEFGNSSITASPADHFFPAGLYYDFAINQDEESTVTNIAVVRAGTTDGTVYLSEKE